MSYVVLCLTVQRWLVAWWQMTIGDGNYSSVLTATSAVVAITTVTSDQQKPKPAHPTLPAPEPDLNLQELSINGGPSISEALEELHDLSIQIGSRRIQGSLQKKKFRVPRNSYFLVESIINHEQKTVYFGVVLNCMEMPCVPWLQVTTGNDYFSYALTFEDLKLSLELL